MATTMVRHLIQRLNAGARGVEGANLLEAAIVTPLVLVLTFGTIEFATVFYTHLALQNGVSQATRYGVTGNTAGGLTRVESIKQAMREATPNFDIPDSAFTFQHMAPGGSTWASGSGGPGAVEKLTVTYSWTFFTPLMRPFFPSGSMTMRVDSVMKNESRFE